MYNIPLTRGNLGTSTIINMKYKTNYLEKYLLDSKEPIKEAYGTLVVDSIRQ